VLMVKRVFTLKRVAAMLVLALGMVLGGVQVAAAPFGQGEFGADVPFGGATSLAISLGGNVNLSLAPNGGSLEGSSSHTVTVTSTDPVGYKLYAYSLDDTDMEGDLGATIPASGNSSASPLSANSWGYNTSGSTTNFIGMTLTPTLIKDADGPYKNGDDTTVTYGALTEADQAAGSYTTSVVYTAVAENQ
jgi:hypothetical protein